MKERLNRKENSELEPIKLKKERPHPPCCDSMSFSSINIETYDNKTRDVLKCTNCGNCWLRESATVERDEPPPLRKEMYWRITVTEADDLIIHKTYPALSRRHHYYVDSQGNECMVLERDISRPAGRTCSVEKYSKALNRKFYFYLSWVDIITGIILLALGIILFYLFMPPFAEITENLSSGPEWFYIVKLVIKAAIPVVLFYGAYNNISYGIMVSRKIIYCGMIHEWADRDMNREFIEFTERTKGKFINMKDDYHSTPLHYAAGRNNIELVYYLLKKGAKTDMQDSEGMTPLMTAAKNGHLDIAKALVDYGTSIEIKTGTRAYSLSGWENRKPVNAADIAMYHGHEDIYFYLKDKVKEKEGNS